MRARIGVSRNARQFEKMVQEERMQKDNVNN
jgi:hypothetical protein